MNCKWICCTLVISLLMGFCYASFGEENEAVECQMIKLVEAKLINPDSPNDHLQNCQCGNSTLCTKALKLHKVRVRLIHWYNVSQKLMAKVKVPDLRSSKWFRMIIEYFAESRLTMV